MSEKDIEKQEENGEASPPEESSPVRRRRYFTRRNSLITVGILAIIAVILSVFTVVLYRYGVFDNYVKAQFVAKMADIGIVFDADVFRLTVSPLELELKNATFSDKVSGEKLFFVRDAHLGLTVDNLYAWQLSRDISIRTTDISGAEVWVRFDENGDSNFKNLKLVEDEAGSRVNFKYDSVTFSLSDSLIHFGDVTHKIKADAKNVTFLLSPEIADVPNPTLPEQVRRFKFNFSSTDSTFIYDEHPVEPVDIRAEGVADRNGAQIGLFKLSTPIAESTMSGTLTDWAALKYDLNVESSVDLTQTSNILPLGTSLKGVGNFKGKVTGEGEKYRVEGVIDSEALTAGGVYLKAVNVTATVEGTNSMYEANGRAVAEMLTFEDFKIDFVKLAGNVRGNGSDFRWLGELEAAAAKSKSLTLGRLFLSDAAAEYKDGRLNGTVGRGQAQRFAVGDVEFAALTARNMKFASDGDNFTLTGPGATASTFSSKDYKINGVTGSDVKVKHVKDRTDVEIAGLKANNAQVNKAKLSNLSASDFKFTDLPRTAEINARNVRATRLDANNVTIGDLVADTVNLFDTTGGDTTIYSDMVHAAKIEAGGAVLGSINVAGVRLTIRQGVITGTSGDIDAGNIALNKGLGLPDGNLDQVKIYKPVFVVEPAGRYRVTADMSLGGGILGSVTLGAAKAKLDLTNERIALNELDASVMDGKLAGNAVIAFNERNRSYIKATFTGLDLSKLAALQSGRMILLEGQTTGSVDLTFAGIPPCYNDQLPRLVPFLFYRNATGTINADITANAGSAERGLVPVNGKVDLTANNGLVNVDYAKLNTEKSEVSATGRVDLACDDSDLKVALNSTDASEIDRVVRVTGIAPDNVIQQLDSYGAAFAGNLTFNGKLKGNFNNPIVDGRASLDSLLLKGRELGSLSTDISYSPMGTELKNGSLRERAGPGVITFSVNMPAGGKDNTSVQATLTNVNAGNLLAALPIKSIPERLSDFNAPTSGTINLTGLPDNSQGEINISSGTGSVAGQAFDSLTAKAVFSGTRIALENLEIRLGTGTLAAKGNYDRGSTAFDLDVDGKNVPLTLVRAMLPDNPSIPVITGLTDLTAKATGFQNRTSSYNVNFNGTARDVFINENAFGVITFDGNTANERLNANLTTNFNGRPQVISGSVNFADDRLPFQIETTLDRSPLEPFIALVPQLKGVEIGGVGTGRVEVNGFFAAKDENGNSAPVAVNGTAQFSQLELLVQDQPLNATGPVSVRFSENELVFENAKFSGSGSNMEISGTVAFSENGISNLAVDGRVNLSLLNIIPQIAASDTFFSGYADVAVRVTGTKSAPRLSGTANLDNSAIATFIGTDRITVDRLKARIIFTSNQAQIQNATGYLGGGKFTASGGALLNGLKLQAFSLSLNGTNVTVPLPQDFITTGDARLEISGRSLGSGNLAVRIAGNIVAKRSLYTKDIDLANIVGGRREGSLSGPSNLVAPRFDLTIEGRDALIVRNNIADLTASVSLHLSGTADNPIISGRITANSGTVFFRKDRYEVQRGVLDFPPNTTIEPIINLQAESTIAGYQIFVNLSGPLTDTELLNASVRSSPALPQADVISLITTGQLANNEGGIPTLAQTGINTAAEVITDTLINDPIRKATDKLFGLNVFEIDPVISGQRLNPSARLTVGRQINNNLRITYSTNLSQDQNQVLALEYRVSNRLSFIAQYEQRPLSNVTRNRDNFSFEIRLRKRF
jgi:translocation and assembly module TamB